MVNRQTGKSLIGLLDPTCLTEKVVFRKGTLTPSSISSLITSSLTQFEDAPVSTKHISFLPVTSSTWM